MEAKLPVRKCVAELVSGRYAAGERPLLWNDRQSGIECVKTTDGELILLSSSGQQSTPAPYWELLLTAATPVAAAEMPNLGNLQVQPVAYTWTLYGIMKGAPLGRYASILQAGSGS